MRFEDARKMGLVGETTAIGNLGEAIRQRHEGTSLSDTDTEECLMGRYFGLFLKGSGKMEGREMNKGGKFSEGDISLNIVPHEIGKRPQCRVIQDFTERRRRYFSMIPS